MIVCLFNINSRASRNALVICLLAIIFCQSCTQNIYKGYDKQLPNTENLPLHSVFYNDSNEHAYNFHIYVQKKHFSGLVFFKKLQEYYRFSMVSKTGQSMLDMSINENEMILHHVIPPLNKRIIINLVKNDFILFFLTCPISEKHQLRVVEKQNKLAVRIKNCRLGSEFVHLFYDKGNVLSKIGIGAKSSMKRWASFSEYEDNIPARITIDHRSIVNLRMEFYNLELQDK